MKLKTEPYLTQIELWPQTGQHVLAQYDEESIVVYQAYRNEIADYAINHVKFGGEFSLARMSWIKPNFLWMMYRSGWASKQGQERVLAIHMSRVGFDSICQQAIASSFEASGFKDIGSWMEAGSETDVRLQWDPDHAPSGAPVKRRAIQLGLRGAALRSYVEDWITDIEDITEFVHEQSALLHQVGPEGIVIPRERVYPAHKAVGADAWNELAHGKSPHCSHGDSSL